MNTQMLPLYFTSISASGLLNIFSVQKKKKKPPKANWDLRQERPLDKKSRLTEIRMKHLEVEYPVHCLGNAVICTIAIVKAMVFPVVMCDVTAGPQRRLRAKELIFLNCGVGEDS